MTTRTLVYLLFAVCLAGIVGAEEKPVPGATTAAQLRSAAEVNACLANPAIQKRIAELETAVRNLQLAGKCVAFEHQQRQALKPNKDQVFNCYTGAFEKEGSR